MMQPKLITLDFETYYDTGYTLSSMTTEEYIRDSRFESIGFAIKCDSNPAVWVTGTFQEQLQYLRQYDWSKIAMCAHNARFDASILVWRFGLRPAKYIDTMSMAKGLVGLDTPVSLEKLGEYYELERRKGDEVIKAFGKRRQDFTPYELAKYGEYCVNDTEMCHDLLAVMGPRTLKEEMQLQDWTIRCFVEPKLVANTEVLKSELANYHARKGRLLLAAGIQNVEDLRSDAGMARALQALGVDPPTKLSPKQKNPDGTPKEVWAFSKQDVDFMDLLESDDESVVALVEARLGTKSSILQSRIERLLGISLRGLMPMPMQYAGATPTRRWAGDDNVNVQNFPRNKTDKATGNAILSPLRQAISAPPGKLMASADLSQIELRVNCWQSGQLDVLNLLRSGGDTYADMATAVFGYPVDKKKHPNERFVGKTAVLGCGYQCGAKKFQHMLKVDSRRYGIALEDQSIDFAQRVVDTFRAKNAYIKGFWKRADDALHSIAYGLSAQLGPYAISDFKLWLPNGAYLYYPNLLYKEKTGQGEIGCEWTYERVWRRSRVRKHIYGGKFTENITQAVARLFVSDALLRLETIKYNDGRKVFDVVFSVHDELVVLFDENLDLDWVRSVLRWAMTTTPSWAPNIPLDCEVGIGTNYAECK